jgi:hypothetical protein
MAEQNQTIGTGISAKKYLKDQDWKARTVLEGLRIPTPVKLAGLWATVMFMYIYVDIIGFYQPGLIEEILVGKVWVFDITPTWMLMSVMLMTIPALMVYLSLAFFLISLPCLGTWALLGAGTAQMLRSANTMQRFNRGMALLLLAAAWVSVLV